MTAAPITHHTLSIDRIYSADPPHGFHANAEYDVTSHEIVPDKRIVTCYEMRQPQFEALAVERDR